MIGPAICSRLLWRGRLWQCRPSVQLGTLRKRAGDPARQVMKVALIDRCGPKLSAAAPASQLYRSPVFQKSKRYAELHCDEFAILSAKYGLVLADQVIDPYDLTLNGMTAVERRKWANGGRGSWRRRGRPIAAQFILSCSLAPAIGRALFSR
ncbi:DUF6884 domain-containing protein [Herbaspirillum rubrisubalbicans]|uniref:DUF6884 domain-containing protein n=1 Tax=Herbaspirillum rubrisubalbicans TaxID=80842 RepID=UPI00345075C1